MSGWLVFGVALTLAVVTVCSGLLEPDDVEPKDGEEEEEEEEEEAVETERVPGTLRVNIQEEEK